MATETTAVEEATAGSAAAASSVFSVESVGRGDERLRETGPEDDTQPKDKIWHWGLSVFLRSHHRATRRLQEKAEHGGKQSRRKAEKRKTLQNKPNTGGNTTEESKNKTKFWAPLRRPPSYGARSRNACGRTSWTQKVFFECRTR